jgi:hypothetical protein
MAAIVGVAILQLAVSDCLLMEMIGAEPPLLRHAKLFAGQWWVPPKFLKEWSAMTHWFASAMRMTTPGFVVRV